MKDIREGAAALEMKIMRAVHVVGGALMGLVGIGLTVRTLAQGGGLTDLVIGGAILVAGGAVLKAGITGDSDSIASIRRAKALREARREALAEGRRPPVELSEKESIRRIKDDLKRGPLS